MANGSSSSGSTATSWRPDWVELPVAGIFEVEDGKITVWHDYFDAATILSKWPTAPG